jgi:hypothetical protein
LRHETQNGVDEVVAEELRVSDMGKRGDLVRKILEGRSDANIAFRDVRNLGELPGGDA